MVVSQLHDAMMVPATDEDYWTPPQAAIEMGLHYQYIAQALLTGEMSCDLREIRVAQGKQRSVVILSDAVTAWYQERESEAKAAGLTLAKHLTKRYSMQQTFESSDRDGSPIGDGVPNDLVSLDLARQMFSSHFRVDVDEFDRAIDLKSVLVYEISGERMVSEQDIIAIGEAMDSDRGPMIRVLDDGPVSVEQAAKSLGLDVKELQKAVDKGQLRLDPDGTIELGTVVDWYDGVRKPKDGGAKNRYLLVSADDDGPQACDTNGLEPSHYDMMVDVVMSLPDIPAIVDEMSTEFVQKTISRAARFGVGAKPPAAPDVERKKVAVPMTVGMIDSLAYLCVQNGIDMASYLSLAACGADPLPG